MPESGTRLRARSDPVEAAADLQAATVVRKIFEPNIYLYDSYPGGVGLSEPLFRLSESLLEKTQKLISECPCPTGCPSCVGPAGRSGKRVRKLRWKSCGG